MIQGIDSFKPQSGYYIKEISKIFNYLDFCYGKLRGDGIDVNESFIKSNYNRKKENYYTDIFVRKYLNKKIFLNIFGLNSLYFVVEAPNYSTRGQYDIMVCNIDLSNENIYFIFECKILTGYSTQNKFYIEKGIKRFIDGKYTTLGGKCGMIGYIERKTDIEKKIIEKINTLLSANSNINTNSNLAKSSSFQIDYLYESEHHSNEIRIYHFMLDLSDIINIV